MEVREGDGWEDTQIRAWRTGGGRVEHRPGIIPQRISTAFIPVCSRASGSRTHPRHREVPEAGQMLCDTFPAHPPVKLTHSAELMGREDGGGVGDITAETTSGRSWGCSGTSSQVTRGHQDHRDELTSHSQNLLGPRATDSPCPTPPPAGSHGEALEDVPCLVPAPWIPRCHQDC